MGIWNKRGILLVGAALASASIGSNASAAIYNIAASDSVGTDVTFVAGASYLVKWIGIADGGLYDSANVSFCQNSVCSTGFSNAFSSRDLSQPNNNFTLSIFTTGTLYQTAAASLAAYKSGNNISNFTVDIVNGTPGVSQNQGFIPNPFIVTPASVTYRLLVIDTDGTRTNNQGGISLSIERLPAVPEPGTWAMFLIGFATAGVTMRRSRPRRLLAID